MAEECEPQQEIRLQRVHGKGSKFHLKIVDLCSFCATITECHTLGDLEKAEIYFLAFLEAGKPPMKDLRLLLSHGGR